jgi:WD40 repeat protein
LGGTAHAGGVTCVTYAPDGKTLLTAGGDGTARLWDAATGAALRRFEGHGGWVCFAAFAADGKRVAGVGYGSGAGNAVHVWETATGRLLHRLEGHNGGARSAAFSPDGKVLASGGFDHVIRLWDLATGKPLRSLNGHNEGVSSVAFAPGGKALASGSYDGTVRLWDPSNGRQLRSLGAGEQKGVYYLAFSPDGRVLASAGNDQTLRLVEVASGKEIRRLTGHSGLVHMLAFSRDGRTLASASYDSTARLWEVATGKELRRFTGHREWVWSVALSPDGRTLATASKDGTALLWDLPSAAGGGARAVQLSPRDLERLWADLAGEDATAAYQAVWALAGAPDKTVAFLASRLEPASGPAELDPKRIARLIEELDDDEFTVREKATAELEALGAEVEAALRRALAADPSAEVQRRLESLLEKLKQPVGSPKRRRLGRALQVLEQAGTPEARRVLDKLARGTPGAWLTQEARESRDRLDHRPPSGP